ncbi:alpha/beta fold hydrolase [Streptomyces sp. NPDC001889]
MAVPPAPAAAPRPGRRISRISRISQPARIPNLARVSCLTLALAATAAGTAAAPAAASASVSVSPSGEERAGGPKPTVVLVHGAFADASGWSEVVERLRHHGYRVVAPPNPLRGLSSDSASLAGVLRGIEGPVVLAGHSYGGAVITGAAAGNPAVKALVYVSAFMPDEGETLGALSAKFTGSALQPALRPVPYTDGTTSGSDLYIRNDRFHSVFAADLAAGQTRVMAAGQRPIAARAFEEKAGPAAWRTIPSWFVVAKNDRAIAPDLERFEAERAGSHTVEVDSSHVAMMSRPDDVTEVIRRAASDTAGPPALAATGARTEALAALGALAGAALLTGAALLRAGRGRRGPGA